MKKAKKWAAAILAILMIYMVVVHIKIYQSIHQPTPESADYLIVLGAKVKGSGPSLSLKYRIEAAADYMLTNKDTIAVVTGGQGQDEKQSEAEVMKRELVERGVEEDRIIMEDQSTTTLENIEFSKEKLPDAGAKGLIVTNDYHLYRSVDMAKRAGLHISGIPAKTPESVLVKSYICEDLAITKYYLYTLKN